MSSCTCTSSCTLTIGHSILGIIHLQLTEVHDEIITAIKNAKSLYYCDKQFNGKFKGNCNLSLLHMQQYT